MGEELINTPCPICRSNLYIYHVYSDKVIAFSIKCKSCSFRRDSVRDKNDVLCTTNESEDNQWKK